MQIDRIDNLKAFKQIRTNWDEVYAADSQAHFFLSWVWLSGWLPIVHESWFILAAKADDDSYVAFFPLKTLIKYESGRFETTISMVGNSMADYTGLICQPDYEESAISAFSAYIKKLSWHSFDLKSILATDTRMPLFLQNFDDSDRFKLSQLRVQSVNREDPDNYVAPHVSLPDSWDSYLQSHLSSNTRQKIRRYLRKVENNSKFRITQLNADNLNLQIEILLGFWGARWGKQMGNNYDVVINYYRLILHHCFQNNCLYLPVLWQNDRPLGAIANFIDIQQKSMLFVIAGRDMSVKNPPSGLILHASAIRYAIANGYKIYDFLIGDEEYKYSFGVNERHIKHIAIENTNYHQKSQDSEEILSLALRHAVKHHRANRLNKAELEYHRILEMDSNYSEALYGLAVLKRQKQEYQTARELLEQLLQVQSNSFKAWFSLGNLYQTQGQLPDAIQAYNRVLKLQPDAIAAHNNLGYALQQQGKWSEAIACYQKALDLQPDCLEAEVNRANALYALGELAPDKQEHYALLNNDLGFQCRQIGDFKTAIAYYQQSLDLNPNLTEARENLSLLQKTMVMHS